MIGLATHLNKTGRFGVCGTNSPLQTREPGRVDCLRCRRTKEFRVVNAFAKLAAAEKQFIAKRCHL